MNVHSRTFFVFSFENVVEFLKEQLRNRWTLDIQSLPGGNANNANSHNALITLLQVKTRYESVKDRHAGKEEWKGKTLHCDLFALV